MSELYKGSYAPEMYSEERRYYLLQAQQLANLTDAELRDMHNMSQTGLRRFIQVQLGDHAAIGSGYLISENTSDSTNNFNITGGTGTVEDPGVYFLQGYRTFLKGDISYKDQTSTASESFNEHRSRSH